jgi:hypothetical protein
VAAGRGNLALAWVTTCLTLTVFNNTAGELTLPRRWAFIQLASEENYLRLERLFLRCLPMMPSILYRRNHRQTDGWFYSIIPTMRILNKTIMLLMIALFNNLLIYNVLFLLCGYRRMYLDIDTLQKTPFHLW